MTDEEKIKELTRSSFAAQMAMLGYEPNGNPKDMVEVVRCKDCKNRPKYPNAFGADIDGKWCYWCEHLKKWEPDDWFCADGKRR